MTKRSDPVEALITRPCAGRSTKLESKGNKEKKETKATKATKATRETKVTKAIEAKWAPKGRRD